MIDWNLEFTKPKTIRKSHGKSPNFRFVPLSNLVFLSIIVLLIRGNTALFAKPTFIIEDLDTTRFPQVELTLRDNQPHPLNTGNLIVAEEMEGGRTIPLDLEVKRQSGVEPIQVVVSIQPTDSKAINQWSTDLVTSLASVLESKDKLHVHIQEEKRFLFLKNRNYRNLRDGFLLPSVETYSKTLESVSQLLDNLTISGKKPPYLVLVLHSKSIPDKHHLVELSKKSRRMGIPIHILSFESREALKLTEYTDGKHYSLADKHSTKQLFDDILYKKNPPYKVRYVSRKEVPLWEERTIQIDIGILNVQNLSTDYKINFFTRLENLIRNPYVFIPSALFLFLIFLSALILLPRNKRKKNNQSKITKSGYPSQGEGFAQRDFDEDELDYEKDFREGVRDIEEERVYEQMYGKNPHPGTGHYPGMDSPSGKDGGSGNPYRQPINPNLSHMPYSDYSPESIYESHLEEIDTGHSSLTEELGGEAYNKAVLIQKEGPNPGKQFNLYGHETLIGRLETNHLVIWDNSLSPVHARIKRIQNKFVIYDMLSHSGVFLNGKKLLRPKVLYDFDEIQLGRTVLLFRGK